MCLVTVLFFLSNGPSLGNLSFFFLSDFWTLFVLCWHIFFLMYPGQIFKIPDYYGFLYLGYGLVRSTPYCYYSKVPGCGTTQSFCRCHYETEICPGEGVCVERDTNSSYSCPFFLSLLIHCWPWSVFPSTLGLATSQ